MLNDGDTIWEDSQLITAAKEGTVCVLDGCEKIHWSALESLASLIHHRRIDLPNGDRLVGEEEYALLKQQCSLTDDQMKERGIFSIPSSFRLILVGDSEISESRWINDAILSLVPFYKLDTLSVPAQTDVVLKLVPDANKDDTINMVNFVESLRRSHDAGLRGVAISLSLRKMIHIAKRNALHPGELRSLIEKAALARFLPSITKTAFDNMLDKAQIVNSNKVASEQGLDLDLEKLTRVNHVNEGDEAMVPKILYYDNEQHTSIMRDMARDFVLGSHLLLIGNQGVGKNKVTDQFLHLINRPRLYIQLHRDTTVESLTIQCSIENGIVKHEESALVKAVRGGYVLVVDEADKAPLHVIAVLKSLLDTGTLLIGDGRRIQPGHYPATDRTIALHPDFRMIMLANRPGFPFLGNDLFGVLGDLFSVHTVDNPSRDSEVVMLRKYGPNVPEENLQKLVSAFSELRDMADQGTLQYPYSTRELVNIIKHVNAFPEDALTTVVKNVLDFDEYSTEAVKTIEEVFRKHGIPLGINRPSERIFLARRFEIAPPERIGQWGVKDNVIPHDLHNNLSPLHVTKSVLLDGNQLKLEKQNMRTEQFSEQECYWNIPMLDVNICSDILNIDNRLVVAAVNPLSLYIVKDIESTEFVEEYFLSDFIPNRSSRLKFHPRLRLTQLGEHKILIHEEITNVLLSFDLHTKELRKIDLFGVLLSKIGNLVAEDDRWRMASGENPLLFERNGNQIKIIFPSEDVLKIETQSPIATVLPVTGQRWIIKHTDNSLSLLCNEDGKWRIRPVDTEFSNDLDVQALKVNEKTVVFSSPDHYYVKSDGFPLVNSSTDIHGVARSHPTEVVDHRRPFYLSDEATKKFIDYNKESLLLTYDVVINARPSWVVPKNAISADVPISRIGGFLEAVDMKNGFVQYVPVPEPYRQSYHGSWLASISKTPFLMTPYGDSKMATVDTNGTIRTFEISPTSLGKSFNAWKQMIGEEEEKLRMEYERKESDFDFSKLDDPKLGKFDPDNTPHVGGNQWMGGTGGYNTAGMGGVGGPFRLDAGHDVHQMPDFAKQQVPPHLLEKARAIAKEEYAKKLKEIKMSEYDADAYENLWTKVQKQSTRMKSIVEQLEAKKKERQWVRHQTSGDLDDGKLIEGVTGEKNIYRRRMDKLPEPGTPQEKPKKIRLVFDVSGSMYRFNGYDKRLQRSLEACLTVMTSFDGKQEKVMYDIVGHSGDSPCTNFVTKGNYPKNNKERLDVLKQMLAHTQYCASGDYTTEGLQMAIKDLEKENDFDEKFVILVSDANLDRYGIKPKHIKDIMNDSEDVNSFVIFIGSLGEQAERLKKALPAGKAFVCKDTEELPVIMQHIFSSTLV